MEMGRAYSKKWAGRIARTEESRLTKTLHAGTTKEREEIKATTKQKMARRRGKEGGNHLEQDSVRQKLLEGIDGGLHPAVDGQRPGER